MVKGYLLVQRGNIGYVLNLGMFLQDQIIYSVHFLKLKRIVGCREEELISMNDPWLPSYFETHDWVRTRVSLTVDGQIVVPAGTQGKILKVLRHMPQGVHYHVHFPKQVLQVPEDLLEPVHATVSL